MVINRSKKMKQTRRSVFETNSSSTHSLSICSSGDFRAWKNEEVLFDSHEDTFVKREDALAKIKKDNPKLVLGDREEEGRVLHEIGILTYKQYFFESEYLERFQEQRNVGGVDVVAFGKYGYKG